MEYDLFTSKSVGVACVSSPVLQRLNALEQRLFLLWCHLVELDAVAVAQPTVALLFPVHRDRQAHDKQRKLHDPAPERELMEVTLAGESPAREKGRQGGHISGNVNNSTTPEPQPPPRPSPPPSQFTTNLRTNPTTTTRASTITRVPQLKTTLRALHRPQPHRQAPPQTTHTRTHTFTHSHTDTAPGEAGTPQHGSQRLTRSSL